MIAQVFWKSEWNWHDFASRLILKFEKKKKNILNRYLEDKKSIKLCLKVKMECFDEF